MGNSTRQMTHTERPNHALQRTAPCVTAPASAAAFPPTMQVPRRTPQSLSLGSLGVTPRLVLKHASFKACRESVTYPVTHGLVRVSHAISSSRSFSSTPPISECASTDRRFSSFLSPMRSEDTRLLPVVVREISPNNVTPNHALQRTAPRVTVAAISGSNPSRPSVALSYVRGLFLSPTTQLPRHAPPSLSLGSLGVATHTYVPSH